MKLNASVAAVCVDFDRADSPHVLSRSNFTFVAFDNGTDAASGAPTLKPKPGLKARARGAALRLDTARDGEREVRLGFLRTWSSGAVARVSCAPPCHCSLLMLSTHAEAHTSTTAFESVPGGVRSPEGVSCQLELQLLTDAQPFKLVSMHVS